MYKLILFLGICSALASGSKPPEHLLAKHPARHPARLPAPDNKCQKIVGCYYNSNENDVPRETLNIDMIDVSLCTHLFYGMATLGKNAAVKESYGYTDIVINGSQRMNDLRKKNRRLKTLIAMEELLVDDTGNNINNKILFDPTLREKLVNNVVNFVQKYNFNGIELQSQYLDKNNAVASDKQNFVLLLKALKEKFDKNGLVLSLAVDFRESTAKKYDIKGISKYVSFINLRTYNFHGDFYNFDKIVKTGHVAPLYHSSKENTEDRKLNVDYIVKYWLSEGAPPSKLILGTTVNGLEFTLANQNKVGSNISVAQKTTLPITYYEICPMEKNRVWTRFYDKEQQVPYIYKGKDMISYDDVDSIKRKAEYAKSMKLGGVFVNSIDEDDFSGHCGGEKSPLLKTVNRVLRDKC